MAKLVAVYVAIITVEAAALSWRFSENPPLASDPLSVWLGWVGIGSMVLLLVYSVARRSRTLRRWARLSRWLHFHIFLAVQGVLCVVFHCYHLILRTAPLAGLNPGLLSLGAVTVVFGSGLFGRYLYSLLPRSVGGVQMSSREVESELEALDSELVGRIEHLWKDLGSAAGAALRARRSARELRALNLPADQHALAARRVVLEHKRAALKSTERVFRLWIVLHRPLAAILYILVAVHVILSYMFTPSLGT